MINKQNRFYTPHSDPDDVKSPPSLPEAGLLPFDIASIPERSCQWSKRSDRPPSTAVRLTHPFLILRMKFGLCVGLGCTTSPACNDVQKIELTSENPKQISWKLGYNPPPRTYIALKCWHMKFGWLLFQDEYRPRKIGSIILPEIRTRITNAIATAEKESNEVKK